MTRVFLALALSLPLFPAAASVDPTQQASLNPGSAVKANVDEVLVDFVVRDKKGKPITDLQPGDVVITDNGAAQQPLGFRLVQGAEALAPAGTTKLSPLRQFRLVTLAFEPLPEPDQRKIARNAAVNLVKQEQPANTLYSVVMINTQLLLLQPFTTDKAALTKAIEAATSGLSVTKLASESDSIKTQLKRAVGGAGQDAATLVTAFETATGATGQGADNANVLLSQVMLDMLRMDASMATDSTRLSISSLQSLVRGLQPIPGRKSVMYFTTGMFLRPELDTPFRSLLSQANRANVTFYSIDSRGVSFASQNKAAAEQLRSAGKASNMTTGLPGASDGGETAFSAAAADTARRQEGSVSKEEILAADTAETSSRANVQLPIRDLAEATGGFLIGDSNDLRGPLRQVSEEIGSYYELAYNPGITQYDGSFRKIKLDLKRKDVVVHARNGYFALPPEARAAGLMPYELPLLKAIADAKLSNDVPFYSGAAVLQPKSEGTDASVLVEVPLRSLLPKTDNSGAMNVHVSLAALIKDASGSVVQKLSRDRSFRITPEQQKAGNFLEKTTVPLKPGNYTLESVVQDRETGKMGLQKIAFTIRPAQKGVAVSGMTGVRSYVPNAKNLDASEPFQFQGGIITPTLNLHVPKTNDAVLRLFFTVYQDASITSAPAVELEFMRAGNVLQKVPLQMPAADAQGRIPYVMTIPASAIPPGDYEIRVVASQGDTKADSKIQVTIEGA